MKKKHLFAGVAGSLLALTAVPSLSQLAAQATPGSNAPSVGSAAQAASGSKAASAGSPEEAKHLAIAEFVSSTKADSVETSETTRATKAAATGEPTQRDETTLADTTQAELGTAQAPSTTPGTPATDEPVTDEVIADVAKPVVTLVTPATSAAQRSSAVAIQVDATDDAGLDVITANIYSGTTLVKSTSTRVGGATSATHTATVDLPAGEYTIRYNARDTSGKVSSTGSHAVVIDQTRPTAQLVAPTASLTNKPVEITVDAADAHGVDRITANIYSGSTLVKSTSTRVGGATSGTHTATVDLPEGDYTIRYNASDVAGNIAVTGQFPLTVDTTRPTAELVTPTSSTPQKSGIVHITMNAADAHGVDRITANIYKDGALYQSTSTKVGGALTGTHDATVDLAAGQYTIRYNSRDMAGNTSITRELPIVIDQTRPTAELVTPTGSVVKALDIRVDAADAHGLDRITANIYQDGLLVKSTSTKVDGATSGTHTANVTLPDGEYTIRYNASDLAGNIAATGNHTVTLDTVAPTVTVKEGAKPGERSFKLYDAGKIDRLTLNGVEKDLTDNPWSDLNGVTPGTFGAVEGTNTLVVFDKAGNATTVTFELDSIAPTVTGIEQTYQEKEGGRIAVTLTFSEKLASAPGQGWYGSGTTYTKVYYSTKEHTIDFRDVAGNAGSYTFTVIPIAPSA